MAFTVGFKFEISLDTVDENEEIHTQAYPPYPVLRNGVTSLDLVVQTLLVD